VAAQLLIAYFFTCGPLVLVLGAWAILWRGKQWPRSIALLALSIVTANALLAAWNFLYYQFRSVAQHPPPWQDPENLNFGVLFLLAPVGIILGLVAAAKGAPTPKWLMVVLLVASLPLLLVSFLAAVSV
jgi:hypothetical protein